MQHTDITVREKISEQNYIGSTRNFVESYAWQRSQSTGQRHCLVFVLKLRLEYFGGLSADRGGGSVTEEISRLCLQTLYARVDKAYSSLNHLIDYTSRPVISRADIDFVALQNDWDTQGIAQYHCITAGHWLTTEEHHSFYIVYGLICPMTWYSQSIILTYLEYWKKLD